MRNWNLFSGLIILLTVLNNPVTAIAQDWDTINPDGVEILADTVLVRALIVTIEPGETIGPVTHPAHFVFILDDGTIRVTYGEQEPVSMELKKGMSLFSDPEGPHTTENTGDEPISFLLVELNEHPYKEP